MGSCSGITGTGARCRAIAITGSDYCHAHHPDRAKQRARAARKGGQRGGRGRPGADLAHLKQSVQTVIDDVLEGKVAQGPGAVALQGYNVLLIASKLELEIREQTELTERLEQLEEALERQKQGGGRWGSRIG
jgi:hypothetical protein